MRKTTRVEDQAYSLLGLFGVHMSLLYGEGKNAFRRLQEELIRTSTDHTIFAWWGRDAFPDYRNSLLAESPADFRVSDSIVSHVWPLEYEPDRRAAKKTYAITNGGLEIELPVLCDVEEVEYHLVRKRRLREPHLFTIGLLNCKDSKFQGLGLGVALKAEGPGTFRLHGNPIPLTWGTSSSSRSKPLSLPSTPQAVLVHCDDGSIRQASIDVSPGMPSYIEQGHLLRKVYTWRVSVRCLAPTLPNLQLPVS